MKWVSILMRNSTNVGDDVKRFNDKIVAFTFAVRGKIDDLLKRGAITPLPRTVFEMDDLEKAFRFMTTGTHIGKVLIKIREEESAKVCLTPRRLFKGVPRYDISFEEF